MRGTEKGGEIEKRKEGKRQTQRTDLKENLRVTGRKRRRKKEEVSFNEYQVFSPEDDGRQIVIRRQFCSRYLNTSQTQI